MHESNEAANFNPFLSWPKAEYKHVIKIIKNAIGLKGKNILFLNYFVYYVPFVIVSWQNKNMFITKCALCMQHERWIVATAF